MRKILFVGQRWCKPIAEAVGTNPLVETDHLIIERVHDLISFIFRVPQSARLIRVGFRPGALSLAGVAIDTLTLLYAAIRGPSAVSFYWIGTDVQNAVRDQSHLRHTPFFYLFKRCKHLAGHDTLTQSLSRIGITSATIPVPFVFPEPLTGLELQQAPLRMKVLTYIPDARSNFYGGPMILDAAHVFPEIDFEVMGGEGTWVSDSGRPANLRFLGWLPETRSAFLRATHVARLVEHDALGGTILEAWSYGRRAIYTRAMPGVLHVPFEDAGALRQVLRAELSEFQKYGFVLNEQGMAIAEDRNRFVEHRDQILGFVN